MNRKMLSAVAASAIAFGLIGCGSSSSSSSNNSSSQPTKVKGVDGYVMNAKMSVNYWNADKNVTQSVKVDVSKSYYLTVDAATNKKKAGQPIYSLADLNSTVLKNVVSVVMSSQAQGKLADGSVYAQSFYDADGNGEYNSSVDVLIPSGLSLKAPKGYSVVTPISTIIASQVESQLASDKNESNLTNVVDAYTKDVANALGVDASTLKNVDPLTLVKSKDEKAQAYVVANAFAGAMIANGDSPAKLFNALKKAKAPKTAADVIGNLATAATAANDNTVAKLLTQVQSLIKTDKTNLETLIKANLDKTRTLSVNNGSLQIAALESAPKDFNITSMTSIVGGNGYKIPTSSLDNINITLNPNEQNITNQKFTFVVRVADPKQFNAQDANVSSLTVKVPFDVNATNGNIAAAIPADAKVTYEGMNAAGTKIISGETNSTIFGTNHTIISVSGNTITIKAKTLIDDVDNNQTSSDKFFGNGLPSQIAELQAGIVTDAAAQVDSNGNYILPTKDSIVSVGGTINENVNSMISFNVPKDLVADMRFTGSAARANADGNASVSGPVATAGNNIVGVNQNSLNTLREIDFNSTADENITLRFSDSSIDSSFEKNATLGSVDFNDTLGGALNVNHTSLTNISSTTNKDGVNELNVTVDYSKINALTTAGHPTAMLTFKATDEFGATGNEENATLWFNRAPKGIELNTSATDDLNITYIVANANHGGGWMSAYPNGRTPVESNTSVVGSAANDINGTTLYACIKFNDPDGSSDANISSAAGSILFSAIDSNNSSVTVNRVNNTTVTFISSTDNNVSTIVLSNNVFNNGNSYCPQGQYPLTLTFKSDSNVTAANKIISQTLDLNFTVRDSYGATGTGNIKVITH